MKRVTSHLRAHLLEHLGVFDPDPIPDLDQLYQTEWCPEFEQLRRNRMVMGRFRYGQLCKKNKAKRDRIGSILRRAELYAETGNAECLVDIANIAMTEFVEQNHPNFHFASEDDGYHDQEVV